jgi:hypothetical protein
MGREGKGTEFCAQLAEVPISMFTEKKRMQANLADILYMEPPK